MKNIYWLVALIIIGGVFIFWWSVDRTDAPVLVEEAEVELTGEVKDFTVTGGNYYYSETELQANLGDVVRITFTSDEGFHDLVIDEFGVATRQLRAEDGSDTIEFVADKAGEFEYYCSVGQHRALGQVGRLIISD